MSQRKLSVAFGIFGLLQLGLAIFHLPGMQCPLLNAVGIPCPGCGASRACAALVEGDWRQYVHMHAFAPFFLLAIVLFLTAGILPRARSVPIVLWIDRTERRTGIVNLLIAALILYWVARLIYAPTDFIRAMKG